MATTQYDSFGSASRALNFSIRRIIRIVPIYAIVTTLEYLHRMDRGGPYTFVNYVKSLFFVPYAGEGGLYRPVLGQGWTLNYEMFFYLIFALALCLNRPVGLLLSAGTFVLLAALHGTVTSSGAAYFYTDNILLYFVCGMLVAVINKRWHFQIFNPLLPTVGVILLMASAVVLRVNVSETFLPVGLSIVIACVYLCASYGSEVSNRVQAGLERLGDASYSTYLFHGFLLGALRVMAKCVADHHYAAAAVFVLLTVVVANLAGLVAFTFVEHPIARYFARRERALMTAASQRHD
jgi:exopolysaccharide production protein ExoZ